MSYHIKYRYEQFDVKHEDPPQITEINTDSQVADIKSKIKMEPDDCEEFLDAKQKDINIEIEIKAEHDVVSTMKTESEVVNRDDCFNSLLEVNKTKRYIGKDEANNTPLVEKNEYLKTNGLCGNGRVEEEPHNFDTRNGEDKFTCNICSKSFTWKSSLFVHMQSHSDCDQFTCEICGRSFSRKCHLKTHSIIHNYSKSYTCSVCNKTFAFKSSLLSHVNVHSSEKPYNCDYCSKPFYKMSSLSKHRHVHDKKPYVCDICKKSFSRKSYLDRHVQLHISEKAFSCVVCGANFFKKSLLNYHKTAHSGADVYKCNICTKSYAKISSLRSHVMKAHTSDFFTIEKKPQIRVYGTKCNGQK